MDDRSSGSYSSTAGSVFDVYDSITDASLDSLVEEECLHMEMYNSSLHFNTFPELTNDDIAITTAMLAIFSGSVSNSPIQPSNGFKPYDPTVDQFMFENKSCGQKMIKNSISLLRRIDNMRDDALASSNDQLHHVMSERKRREKLNGSFHALKMLLPLGSKKDKASVLHKTKDYLKTLISQISELEAKKRALEEHLSPIASDINDNIIDGSTGKLYVQVLESIQETEGVQRVTIKIVVAVECNLVELALSVLECMKMMRIDNLVSMDAKRHSSDLPTWMLIKFAVKDSEWDEVTFNETIINVIDVML